MSHVKFDATLCCRGKEFRGPIQKYTARNPFFTYELLFLHFTFVQIKD